MSKASLNADYVRTEISRWQARSMAISTRGIVAAESPLAAQAGAVVLARGGHAAEAAIAANAVMGVVAPMMNGIFSPPINITASYSAALTRPIATSLGIR